MALAFGFSADARPLPGEDAARVAAHLPRVGLPDGLARAGSTRDGATLVEHMRHDKKMRRGGILPFLLARGIGQTYLDKSVDLADVADFLDRA